MVVGEVAVASKGGVVCGRLGWWIRLGGDEIGGTAGVDLSGKGAVNGRIGLWDGLWVQAFPKSCNWSWCGRLMAAVAVRSDEAGLVCFGVVGINDGSLDLEVWALAFDLGVCVGSRSVMVRLGWGDGCPPLGLMVFPWRWSDLGCSGGAVVRVMWLWYWAWLAGLWSLFRSLAKNWAWILSVGIYFYYHVLCYFYFLVVCGFRPVISLYHFMVGLGELCLGLRTLCAWFALVRWCTLVKWSQPPSGRMKCRATESFGWLHSEKAELIGNLWLCFSMIFLICRLYCKAVGIAFNAIPAKWRLFEYMFLVETLAIIVRRSLDAYCNLGFRHYVPPLYSIVSLIKV